MGIFNWFRPSSVYCRRVQVKCKKVIQLHSTRSSTRWTSQKTPLVITGPSHGRFSLSSHENLHSCLQLRVLGLPKGRASGLAAPINGQLANWTTRMSSGQTERERVPKCQVGFNVESNNYTHGKGHTAPGTTTHGRPEQLASVLSICKINNALRRKRKTEQVS